ncbi:hypothetical protein FACS1894184_01280 [Clostridia bacterium]|nr:hypothetical protein FACS1894184_01280 [Clostridia bacterium]
MKYSLLSKRLLAVALAILMLTGIAGVGYAAETSGVSAYSLVLTRTLYQGSTGSDVRAVQTILKQLGYLTSSVDGIFGSKTAAAVKAFQTRNGLYADGQVGNNTFQKMISPSAIANGSSGSGSGNSSTARSYLRYGDSGSEVLAMQRALQALGYYNGVLSGKFQDQTLAAVRLFQSRNGLSVDGLAGRLTLTLLYSGRAIPNYTQPPTQKPTQRPPVKPTQTPTVQRTLYQGMRGDDVAALQSRLYQLGYYAGPIDGNYNQSTVNAVRQFQSRNNLYTDGITGPQTWQRAFSNSAVPNNPVNPPKPPVNPTKPPVNPPNNISAPSSISFATQGTTGVLSWNRVNNATGYDIRLTIAGVTKSYSIDNGNTTSFNIPRDMYLPGNTLQFSIRTRGWNGALSNWVSDSIRLDGYTPPPVVTAEPAPSLTMPSGVSISGSTIKWNAVKGAQKYYVEVVGSGFYYDVVTAQPSISIEYYTALTPGTTFNAHVTPMANGVNGPTAIAQLTVPGKIVQPILPILPIEPVQPVQPILPIEPELPPAVEIEPPVAIIAPPASAPKPKFSSNSVSWAKVPGAETYYITLAVYDTATGDQLASKDWFVSDLSVPLPDEFGPGTTLRWSIDARNSAGTGPSSSGAASL